MNSLHSRLLMTVAMATAVSPAMADGYFERVATWPVYLNLPEGSDPAIETVAEIVAATPDGQTLIYTDSPGDRLGLVDIADPSAPQPAGLIDLGGEPTSVSVLGEIALAGVNTSESYVDASGHLAVVDLSAGEVIARCELGGQPDSVAVSPDGSFVAIAIENERDEDLDDGILPQMPAGFLAVFDLGEDGSPSNCDDVQKIDLTGLAEVGGDDPEPEFVDINSAGHAVVTMQENNHIAIVDLASGEVVEHFPAGTSDVFATDVLENDLVESDGILRDLKREPDAVAWVDDNRFVTANEGDYEGGSRGFTIFDVSGEVQHDSGNLMEYLAMLHGQYPEFRAENKGVEPEGVDVGMYGDDLLIFVNAERANFVAVFADKGAGSSPEYMQFLPTAVGPEGLLALPSRDLLIVASEVDEEDNGLRASIGIYQRGATSPSYPQLSAAFDPQNGTPVTWGALSGMVGDPEDANRLYAVSDSAYSISRIYEIELLGDQGKIVGSMDLTIDGAPANYDLEGIAVSADGGFWLASEGNPEKDNPQQQRSQLVHVDATGAVLEEVFLPDELYEQVSRFGFEGVASFDHAGVETLAVAFQRSWGDDPEDMVKIGFYDTQTKSWAFAHYGLEKPLSERGGWVGLSEITTLEDGRFALIERDNQPGTYAAIKSVSLISLEGVEPAALGEPLPVISKSIAVDLLPTLQASAGWVADKPESLALTADGRLFMATDNDASDDAHGETVFAPIAELVDLR